MDNKEFAQILLSEAVELLNEGSKSSRYNRLTNLGKKQDDINSKKEENLKKLSNEEMKRDLYNKNPITSFMDTAKMKLENKKLDYENYKIKKEAEKISSRVDPDNITESMKDKYRMHGPQVGKYTDRKRKEAFNKKYGGHEPPNVGLHNRLNKRGKLFKSQHESIAILLTEAALLLNNED